MREMSQTESERLLRRQGIGRLGLYDSEHDRVYVVPISYVFHKGSAYFHSVPGLKLELLVNHPQHVCLHVDAIADEGEWESVVAWGRFAEITDEAERVRVLRSFGQRLFRGPLRDHQNIGRSGELGAGEIVYRVDVEELTGRADSSGWTARESD